jgi:hypothetical protein
VHLDYLSIFSGIQAEKVGNPNEQKCENCTKAEKTKYCAMKLSQIQNSEVNNV